MGGIQLDLKQIPPRQGSPVCAGGFGRWAKQKPLARQAPAAIKMLVSCRAGFAVGLY